MKNLILIPLIVFSATLATSAEIASVDFDDVEAVLRDYLFSQEKQFQLRDRYLATSEPDPGSMVKQDENGKIVIDQEMIENAMLMQTAYEVEREVEEAMRRELILIVNDMALGYDLVINSSESNAILFSNTEIADITQRVYQEIVVRLSNPDASNEVTDAP